MQYRTDAEELVVKGGASWGAIRGWEKQLVLAAPGETLTLPVEGLTTGMKLRTSAGLAAALSGNTLRITVEKEAKPPFFGYVTLVGGDGAEKTLTILAANQARFIPASAAQPEKGAAPLPADDERVNPCVLLQKKGERIRFRFPSLPAGDYLVLTLHRVPTERLINNIGQARYAVYSLIPPGGKPIPAAFGINPAMEFYKAKYGKEMSRFKWDFPIGGKYPFQYPVAVTLPATDSLAFEANGENDVEVAALLILPKPSKAFTAEIIKVLCGLNNDPWRMVDDQL